MKHIVYALTQNNEPKYIGITSSTPERMLAMRRANARFRGNQTPLNLFVLNSTPDIVTIGEFDDREAAYDCRDVMVKTHASTLIAITLSRAGRKPSVGIHRNNK